MGEAPVTRPYYQRRQMTPDRLEGMCTVWRLNIDISSDYSGMYFDYIKKGPCYYINNTNVIGLT